MASILSQLLEAQEPSFSYGMQRLEKATKLSGVDLRLIADIIEKAHAIMRRLGLDPGDTTAPELYASLIGYVRHNNNLGDLFDESDYIMLLIDGVIVSFNLIDIVENLHHELEYRRATHSHGQRSLKGEIVDRYVNHTASHEGTTLEIADTIGLLSTSAVV